MRVSAARVAEGQGDAEGATAVGEGEDCQGMSNDLQVSLDVAPSVLPDISPTRGEIGSVAVATSSSQVGKVVDDGLISPLVGEMSGRTEGGNVER